MKTYAGFRRAWQPVRDGDRHEAIDAFVETLLALYADDRDFPAREGTSRLSPLIASGEITVADCAAAALEAPPSKGREKWLDELCWHEWFEHVKSSGLDAPRREPMHNRARMVTASFLVKHLHLDWRTGEAWFAEKLVDYDPAPERGELAVGRRHRDRCAAVVPHPQPGAAARALRSRRRLLPPLASGLGDGRLPGADA